MASGELSVEHIDTEDNSADLLTKPLLAAKFEKHRERLMSLKWTGKLKSQDEPGVATAKKRVTFAGL